MSEFTIYHNPRCSKSRQTLQLLEQHGIAARIVPYLDEPPTPPQLKTLLRKLGIGARELLRSGEDDYRELGLAQVTDENALIAAMSEHPRLIERPIVVRGDRAVLGRPPENVLELLK